MNSTDVSSLSNYPSGQPIAGSSAGGVDPAFPALHARPAQGWLNDPNGICHRGGRYHVFFQYNPDSTRHETITWGHISSVDLLHWREHAVALRPQSGGPDAFGCWSGVMADDDGVPTAIYSGVSDDSGHSQVTLARGVADLETWQQLGETAAGMPDDDCVTAVRDPFVFRYCGHRYALQGAGLRDGRAAILLYDAENLANWRYLGIWLTSDHPMAGEASTANIWECPQLAEVDGNWLLIVSLWRGADEDHHHLSGVAHLVGAMEEDDQGNPAFVPASSGITDSGPDFYAPQLVALPDRTLLWGWSWENRSAEEYEQAGWAGLLTFPRELSLRHGKLAIAPARELEHLRRDELLTGTWTELTGAAEALIEPSAETSGGVTVELKLASPASTRDVLTVTSDSTIRLFVDASIAEVYREGAVTATQRAYPAWDEQWILRTHGSAEVTVWKLAL